MLSELAAIVLWIGFFESPALLLGIPLLAIGLAGMGVAGLTLVTAQRPVTAGGPVERHGAHPGPEEYVRIGITLAVITMVEVAVYYIDIQRATFILILLSLSALKFSMVVLWFMHLKFDSRLFSTAFVGGLSLAVAVFIVIIATLGGNLV